MDIPRALFSNLFVGGSNPIKGDALVIAGATLYAVSNVSEVMCVFISLGCILLSPISGFFLGVFMSGSVPFGS